MSALRVLMGEVVAGSLTRHQGRVSFTYDDSYRRSRGATPLSVSMPLETDAFGDSTVRPWLAGLLPDNSAVLARWARTFQVANSAFALLGTPVGEDCAGAVRFVSDDRLAVATQRPSEVQWLTEADVAARLRDLQRDGSLWLGADFSGRFSLAGAQAKTALLWQNGRWGVPIGAMATSHILKPAISGLDDHDLNEHLCAGAARRAGLSAVNTAIATFEDQSAVVVERYDRYPDTSGMIRRVHQEDLCQALGRPPEQKYQSEGGPTPAEVARLLRRVLPAIAAEEAVRRFLDSLLFNWLIGGTDAHAKNYSIMLSGSQCRLAPLYDLASALPYDVPVQKLRMAMKFGGSYLLAMSTPSVWARVSKDLGLPLDAMRGHAAGLMDALPGCFADSAADPAVIAIGSSLPTRVVDAVAARVRAARHALG